MTIPRSFYFLRHGETDWNLQQLLQGHTDIPLNATGRAQAENIVPVMKNLPIDRVIASTLCRADETARIVNSALQKPMSNDPALIERNFGAFEGKSIRAIDELKDKMIEEGLTPEENGYPCPPAAEPYGVFRARITSAIAGHLDTHAGENILFVVHGGLYRVLRRSLFSVVDQSPNVQPFLFEKTGENWVLHRL